MSEKLGRFNPDVPIKEEEKWDFSDVEFHEKEAENVEKLEPVSINRKTKTNNTREQERKFDHYHHEISKEEKAAKRDTVIGTAAAAAGGAFVGAAGFVGAGLSAPVTLAAIAGAAAYGALKKDEMKVRKKEEDIQRAPDVDWLEEFEKQRKEAEKDRKK